MMSHAKYRGSNAVWIWTIRFLNLRNQKLFCIIFIASRSNLQIELLQVSEEEMCKNVDSQQMPVCTKSSPLNLQLR